MSTSANVTFGDATVEHRVQYCHPFTRTTNDNTVVQHTDPAKVVQRNDIYRRAFFFEETVMAMAIVGGRTHSMRSTQRISGYHFTGCQIVSGAYVQKLMRDTTDEGQRVLASRGLRETETLRMGVRADLANPDNTALACETLLMYDLGEHGRFLFVPFDANKDVVLDAEGRPITKVSDPK